MTSTIPAPPSFGELPPLIPRETLLGNPERANPHISPDGKRLAWLAPDQHEILQVWVQTIGKQDARVVTADKSRGIQTYGWAFDSKTILYTQDAAGDENFHLFAVDLDSHNVRDLTPWQGVRAESRRFESQISRAHAGCAQSARSHIDGRLSRRSAHRCGRARYQKPRRCRGVARRRRYDGSRRHHHDARRRHRASDSRQRGRSLAHADESGARRQPGGVGLHQGWPRDLSQHLFRDGYHAPGAP